MRVCTGGRADRRSCRRSISSRRSSTTRTSTARSPPPTRVSDVYAMGGRPLTALAIAAFPKDGLEPDTIRADLPRRLRQAARGRRRAARRPHRPGSGDQVRLRGDRRDRSRARAVKRRRAARRRAVPDQTSSAPASSAPRSSSIASAPRWRRSGDPLDAHVESRAPPRRCRRCPPAPCTRAPTSPASA